MHSFPAPRPARPIARRALILAVIMLLLTGGLSAITWKASAAGGFTYLITVDADGFERTNKPVEVALNFTTIIDDQGGSGALDPDSIQVAEVGCGGGGGVIDADVPFQFDQAANYHAANNARGTLVFLMQGNTGAAETRCYHVDFDVTGGNPTPPSFPDQVELTDGVSHKGYQSIRIVTADAEYFYHKPGGGFATLFDANNNDWIDWNSAAGGAGDFRGIPNMVHPNDGGYFHPGRNIVSTTVISDGPLKASFKSVSNQGGAWEVLWDIFPDYARMTVVKTGQSNYWWLYEGTPGGALQVSGANADRLTRSNGDSIPASGEWNNDIPGDEWIFVTDPSVGRSLYLIHHQEDTKIDGYKPDNDNLMAIFGFGRNGNLRYLNGLPQQFTLGFVDETAINGVRPVVEDAYKPLVITGSNDDGGGGGPTCDELPYSVLVSPKQAGGVEGVNYGDEDVLKYDGATCEWSLLFDGTAAGLPASANVDALAVNGDDFYLSFLAPLNVPGIGKVSDSDVVLYSSGVFSLYFDGSNFGLTVAAEDIDAIAFDETGNLLISTLGAHTVPGLAKGQDEDLLRLNGGALEVYFDGSHNAGLGPENVAGVDVDANGDLYLSVLNAFNVGGINGNAADIFTCEPSSLGYQNTNCGYSLLWDSVDFGLNSFDAIDIE